MKNAAVFTFVLLAPIVAVAAEPVPCPTFENQSVPCNRAPIESIHSVSELGIELDSGTTNTIRPVNRASATIWSQYPVELSPECSFLGTIRKRLDLSSNSLSAEEEAKISLEVDVLGGNRVVFTRPGQAQASAVYKCP